ncbi:putative ribonuclease H-like domain-containing protein [Tanacetum coccineum]
MPIWKDASYFDSPSKDVGNDETKSTSDDQKQVKDGPYNESDEKGQHVNTASPEVNTGRFKLNIVDLSVNTATCSQWELVIHLKTLMLSSSIEPTSIAKALSDSSWVEAMQEELLQFKLQHVWRHVDLPTGKRVIGTKWVFRNKKDEKGIVIRNKARLVAQGHRQEEGIDYEEVFAPVSRIKGIRLFLAYASFMGFLVYQMDVKSAFLYGTIEEEVYVTQPPGFKDPDHPDKVYKVVKALYGLHQAPRAWYETLANYLLGNGFKRGKIDQTLFIKKQKGDILLVQVYVDDIIFGSTNKELCTGFEKLMKDKFQMSSMGELTFFLGLQVQQKEDGIFISQDKYVAEILKKFNYTDVKSASTPVDLEKPLVKDRDADDVDVHLYRSMIGSLMYLIASRPDIMFACKKQTVVPTSTTEAEYVADASSGPSCQGTIFGDSDAQTRFRLHLNMSNDQPPSHECLGTGKANTVKSNVSYKALNDNKKVNVTELIIDVISLGSSTSLDMSHNSKKILCQNEERRKVIISRRVTTPLFETMMVQPTQDEGVDSGIPTDSNQTPFILTHQASRSSKETIQEGENKEGDTALLQRRHTR